jgi:hypothetical protein
LKKNDYGANHKNREGMAESPKRANKARLRNSPLLGDDCSDCNDMVWISCMTHAKKKPQSENRGK